MSFTVKKDKKYLCIENIDYAFVAKIPVGKNVMESVEAFVKDVEEHAGDSPMSELRANLIGETCYLHRGDDELIRVGKIGRVHPPIRSILSWALNTVLAQAKLYVESKQK